MFGKKKKKEKHVMVLKVVNGTNSLLPGYHVQDCPNYFTYISINSLVFLTPKLRTLPHCELSLSTGGV